MSGNGLGTESEQSDKSLPCGIYILVGQRGSAQQINKNLMYEIMISTMEKHKERRMGRL